MAKMNCHFCSHNPGNGVYRGCERFSQRSDECLSWLEINATQLLREATALMRGQADHDTSSNEKLYEPKPGGEGIRPSRGRDGLAPTSWDE
jgi:hypothetical protein